MNRITHGRDPRILQFPSALSAVSTLWPCNFTVMVHLHHSHQPVSNGSRQHLEAKKTDFSEELETKRKLAGSAN